MKQDVISYVNMFKIRYKIKELEREKHLVYELSIEDKEDIIVKPPRDPIFIESSKPKDDFEEKLSKILTKDLYQKNLEFKEREDKVNIIVLDNTLKSSIKTSISEVIEQNGFEVLIKLVPHGEKSYLLKSEVKSLPKEFCKREIRENLEYKNIFRVNKLNLKNDDKNIKKAYRKYKNKKEEKKEYILELSN